jgi:hypothetical protein
VLANINEILIVIGAIAAFLFGYKQLNKREERQEQKARANERAIEISKKARESRSEPLPSDVDEFLHQRGKLRD